MKKILLIIISLFFSANVFADDGYLEVAGGIAKLMNEHASITMLGENVTIKLNGNDYEVDAKFVFYNNGKSTTVTVGFPEYGWNSNLGKLQDFETYVNGKKVNQINIIEESKKEDYERDARKWKIKEVYFPEKKKTYTKVKYSAPYGGVSDGSRFVTYEIGTGQSWHGAIGKSTFTIVFEDNTRLFISDSQPFERDLRSNNSKFIRKRNALIWYVDSFEPNIYEKIFFTIAGRQEMWESPFYARNFGFRDLPIDKNILKKLSLNQLRLLRNEFFARHGRMFKDETLQKYFETKKWYEARKDFTGKYMNQTEKDNIKTILEYENELKKQ